MQNAWEMQRHWPLAAGPRAAGPDDSALPRGGLSQRLAFTQLQRQDNLGHILKRTFAAAHFIQQLDALPSEFFLIDHHRGEPAQDGAFSPRSPKGHERHLLRHLHSQAAQHQVKHFSLGIE